METLTSIDPEAFRKMRIGDVIVPGRAATAFLLVAIELKGCLSLETGPFIAGGSVVRAIIDSEAVSDIDVFCCTSEQFAKMTEYLSKIGGEVDWTKQKPSLAFEEGEEEDAPISIMNFTLDGFMVQVIDVERRAIPGSDPKKVLLGFDIIASMIGTDGSDVLVYERALSDIIKRQVNLNGSKYREDLLKVRPHLNRTEARVQKYKALFGLTDPAENF